MTNEHPGLGFGLLKCLRQIKLLLNKGANQLLVKHFEIRLIDELKTWTRHRNSIYKNLIDTHVSLPRIKKMAEEGIILYQEMNTAYKNFKKDWTKDLVKDVSTQVEPDETTA